MSYNTPSRILLIEPLEIVRVGLRAALRESPGFAIVAETGDLDAGLSLTRETRPDIVLMELVFQSCSGIDLAREIRAEQPDAKLFVFSACNDDQCLLDAFSLGVHGYLNKSAPVEGLLSALTEVAGGQSWLDPCLTDRVVNLIREEDNHSPQRLIDGLSKQERRVLTEGAKGLSNKQVADSLRLSEKTVKNYFSNVMKKLSVSRRTEAAVLYWNYDQARQGDG